jgi:cell division protein FtsB
MKKKQIKYSKILKSMKSIRLLILFFSFLFLFTILALAIIQTYEKMEQTDKQPSLLSAELEKEKAKYEKNLANSEYYKSDTYIEKEARNTLGLSFPNEDLYVIKKKPTTTPIQEVKPNETVEPIVQTSSENNLDKWLRLIFG